MSSSHNRPKIVCLTGGIGSGKTTVAQMFAQLGVGVYNADSSAKRLMQEDQALRTSLINLLGSNVYNDLGQLNRAWISQKLFNNSELLNQWNALVHPRVAEDFKQWISTQSGPYIIKEAAILFETKGQKNCNVSLLITAPEHERIQRVMKRDSWTRNQVLERLKNQWPDEKKIPLADYILENSDLNVLTKEVSRLHLILTHQLSLL
jgi:dephospho-CoA kinase